MKKFTASAAAGARLLCASVLVAGGIIGGPVATEAAQGDCGQPLSAGSAPVATDALFALAAAVGIQSCDPCICNVDSSTGSSPVSATDALIILSRAVNPSVVLNCPPCIPDCEKTSVPTCGGSCPGDGVCGENILDPGRCRCLNACALSGAPACSGECDEPGEVCRFVQASREGGPAEPGCGCMPPDLESCADSSGPECGGVCHSGALCEFVMGNCACVLQPVQGPCSGAAGPACAGWCARDEICQPGGDGCACVPWTGQPETCVDAGSPVCGGVCGDGGVCAAEIGSGECNCASFCEISAAPVCDGACKDPQQECVAYSVSLPGGSPVEFCVCLPAGN